MELEIVTIPPDTALSVFTTEGAIRPYLDNVRKVMGGFTADVDTRIGRKEIASFAARIAKYKTAIESAGKTLADEQKLIPKKIDAARKLARDTLDRYHDEVRKPLDNWEEAEQKRIEAHESAIAHITNMAKAMDGRSSEDLRGCLAMVEKVEIGPRCEEYADAYAAEKAKSIAALMPAIAAREKYEAEQIELAKLRQESAERAERDRVEAIRKEAELQAERAAAARIAKGIADAQAAQEEAQRAAQREREAYDKREADLKAQAEASERRAQETEQRLKREADERAAAERAALARREADTKHRAAINRKALEALVAGGITDDVAKTVIKLIAQKAIPNVTISY